MRANPKDLLKQGEIVLKERGIENHRFDAFNIHHKHFKMNRAELLLAKEQELSDEWKEVYGYFRAQENEREEIARLLDATFGGFKQEQIRKAVSRQL